MLGNFIYHNPTKIYFGDKSLSNLKDELLKYGKKVLLIYGKGSIKKNGIYDDVIKALNDTKKTIKEISNVMPNPTLSKLYEGIETAKKFNPSLILAVGGGSVVDYSKALSAALCLKGDIWSDCFVKGDEPKGDVVPIGVVLTMVGTGSEMDASSVITNDKTKQKLGHTFEGEKLMPRFSILNPTYTLTLPYTQMVSGIYDIFSHILEQYFSNTDDNTSDYIAEGLMHSVIHSSRIAIKDSNNYEARSNIMWCATIALNSLLSRGKKTDWTVHALGEAVGGYTDAPHGLTLSAVSLCYYNHILPYGLLKFKRFAINVWGVSEKGKSDEQIAKEGLVKMEEWMKELKLSLHLSDFGLKKEDIKKIVPNIALGEGGYKKLTSSDAEKILLSSL